MHMGRILACAAMLAIVVAAPATAANLVVNGGFETGDFTGFSQFGNTGFTGVVDASFGVAPSEGTYQAAFGAIGSPGGINQTITTVAGHGYTFSFDLAADGGNYDTFAVSFNGLVVDFGSNLGAFPYGTHSFNVVGSGSDQISFAFQNDPAYYLLDNISVTNVPEPATWALMIGGFAMTGFAARRRQSGVTA